MSTNNVILWPAPAVLNSLVIVGEYLPVQTWDAQNKSWSDVQRVDEATNLPIWEASALMRVGYQGATELVKVRVPSKTKPVSQVDLSKLASAGISLAEPQRG